MPSVSFDDRSIAIGSQRLAGSLTVPPAARSLIIFAHGSGSSRLSPRNARVAKALNARGFATLLFDLLTEREAADRRNVFDVPLLGGRVAEALAWARGDSATRGLAVGVFGASTGAAAALVAAAQVPHDIRAVVSRGGRPDLAGEALERVRAPTLLVVGGEDHGVIELNKQALARLACEKRLEIVPGAKHLFEEPGALTQVVALAAGWFAHHLTPAGSGA